MTPDWTFEIRATQHPERRRVCGVDEAGRGPLSGPVVAAAVILNPETCPTGLNDSKILSKKRRELLFTEILYTADVGIGISEPAEIDRINILHASLSAMNRAITALPKHPDIGPLHALIDGHKTPPPIPDVSYEPLVKGDARSLSIAAASIIAKVTRDRLMETADLRFPGYGFARHKGYGTQAHKAALSRLGPCPIHRFSFAPIRTAIDARDRA